MRFVAMIDVVKPMDLGNGHPPMGGEGGGWPPGWSLDYTGTNGTREAQVTSPSIPKRNFDRCKTGWPPVPGNSGF